MASSGWRRDNGTTPARQRRAAPAPAATLDVRPGGRRLGELLVADDQISAAQLGEALLHQEGSGKRLGSVLVELGAIDERTLTGVVARQSGLAVADLRQSAPDPEVVALLPQAVARSIQAIPLRAGNGAVEVAVADPSDDVRRRLADAIGRPVQLLVAPPSDVRRAVDNSYRALSGIDRHVEAFEAADATRRATARGPKAVTASDEAPVVQVVNMMVTQALRDRASDIHVEPQDERLRVRYRIDGVLHDVLSLPAAMSPAIASRIKVMAGMNIAERRRPQDGQLTMEVDGRPVDIRVATSTTIWGEKVVLRLLDKTRSMLRLEQLGMPAGTNEVFSHLVRSPFGMVLCAGPTGSGKTTTLYATLTEINSPERNIMTIEDPVEYVFPSINQIQISEQGGITFAGGLKSILRQDPDVILVGEIRDVETARIAVQSALTGHLVLSSLHATDATAALHRFLDMGIESFLIASSVVGVVGQRLVRRICGACKVRYTPPPDELAFYRDAGGRTKRTFWHGEGCNLCAGTGFHDRVGVYELLRVTPEMKELLVEASSHAAIRSLALEQGMTPLRDEAVRLVAEDVTTVAEVVRSMYVV